MIRSIFKRSVLGFAFLIALCGEAQESNVLLDADFWKSNPSIETVKLKVKEGNNPSQANSRNFDPVALGILQGVPNEVIFYLLDQEGNAVDKLTHDGRTYMFWAANKGNVELMTYLLGKGAKTNILDNHGFTVLNFAAATGQKNTKVYDLCLANGADLKSDLDNHGANALLLVSQRAKDFNTIDYFIAKGLDLHSKDAEGNGIFNYVSKSGNIDMLNQLINKSVDYKSLNKVGGNAMIFAAKGGRGTSNGLEVFTFLESKGLKPDVKTTSGETPLHALAGNCKDVAVINYFLNKGVSVNQADENGNTPFLNAASRNNLEVLKLVMPQVNNVNTANKKGETALALAVQQNKTDVVSYLLDQGADVNCIDASGNNLTAYLIKSYSSRQKADFNEKLKVLKTAGLDMVSPQTNGNTLYHLALDQNDFELLELAKQYQSDINYKNKQGLTPLLKAAMSAENDKILKYLLAEGADKTITTQFGETAYDLASENEILKANKININFLK